MRLHTYIVSNEALKGQTSVAGNHESYDVLELEVGSTSAKLRGTKAPVDEDMADQANPCHGIPSQDPNSVAQIPLQPDEADREANSVLIGGGMVAGAATGAAISVAVAGPVGVLVGATMGAVAGAVGGAAAGATAKPAD